MVQMVINNVKFEMIIVMNMMNMKMMIDDEYDENQD